MRTLALIGCLVLCAIEANATTYYFSASGNDLNSGTSAASPFQTIAKLNTLPLAPGDNVLFRCGDVFRGQINIRHSGNSSAPIFIGAYDAGAKPVISGARVVSGWTFNSTYNAYQSSFTDSMENFFVADKEQILARYPNNGRYLYLDSAQKFYIKDADITGVPPSMVNNSKVCVHTAQWCWEKTGVADVTVDKITYSSGLTIAAIANFAYFLYDNIQHLDTAAEWKYSSADQKVYYKPSTGVDPNTLNCEGSVDSFGIKLLNNVSYITIKGITFEKQSKTGVMIGAVNNQYIRIDSCTFARQYEHGVNDKGSYNETSNSHFTEVDGIAMFISGDATNAQVHHNTFRDIGQFRNSGIGTEINLSAIKAAFVDNCHIHHNDIDGAGYCGIAADGRNHIVEKNIIKNVMLINNDGAALKSYGANSKYNIFRNNFISTSDGNSEGGSGSFVTPAIYFDFSTQYSTVQDNTVFGRMKKGIFMNSGTHHNTISGNTVYGFSVALDLNGGDQVDTAISNMDIQGNVFFAKKFTGAQAGTVIRYVDYTNAFTAGVINNNYYIQPFTNLIALKSSPPLLTLAAWRSATGFDMNTVPNSFTWTDSIEDKSKLFMNPTDNVVVQDLEGVQWKDLDDMTVTSLTLQPWTSRILIRTTVPLPLQVISFSANKSGRDVQCDWKTSGEEQVLKYTVMRSKDGKTFSSVGNVNAAGAGSVHEYSLVDVAAADLDSDLYYRLQVAYKDGAVSYSPVARVWWNRGNTIHVYPNPANNYVRVDGENIKSIMLVDGQGNTVWRSASCSSSNQVALSGVAKGVYWLKVMAEDGAIQTQVLVVQ
ncbi:MAG: glycoside hydrolase [Chitinophagaceae bacterium]|nr:glycoside hydrolase [Chitinophagaceae bacterium]